MDTLVSDNWAHIFSFVPTRSRLKLAEASKYCKEIVTRSWTSLEIDLNKKDIHRHEKYDEKMYIKENVKLRQYLTKYCTNLVNLDLVMIDLVEENWLDCVFAIKTLQMISICPNHIQIPGNKLVSKVPSCRDLKLLRLDGPEDVTNETLSLVLSGLPNLTELYLPPRTSFNSVTPFQHTKKLERIGINFKDGLTAEDLIKQCPLLKYILITGFHQRFSYNRVGSTSIISTLIPIKELAGNMERVKIIAPLLRTSDAHIVTGLLDHYDTSKQIIEFLVKEGHVNIEYCGSDRLGEYRPTVLGSFSSNFDQTTALGEAVRKGNIELIRFLIQLGASPEHPYPNDSYFRFAHDTATMKLLLELGADPNKMIIESYRTDTKYPAFMAFLCNQRYTVRQSEPGTIEYLNALKERGVNMNVTNSNGESFFELAIRYTHWTTFHTLMSYRTVKWTSGALSALFDKNTDMFCNLLKEKRIDQKLILPRLAVDFIIKQRKNTNLISEFLQHYADVLSDDGYNTLHHLVVQNISMMRSRRELSYDDYSRWSVVYDFSSEGNIRKGEDRDDDTIMSEQDSEDIDKELKDRIDLMRCNINTTTRDGETALLLVCKSKLESETKLKRIRVLLERKADVNIADKHGWTPLHAACYVHEWNIAKKLINCGAHVNARDKYGITPLMAAIYGCMHTEHNRFSNRSRNLIFIRSFISSTVNQLDLSACDNIWNRSCVHLIACYDEVSIWHKIIGRVDINARDKEGYTPLHYGVLRGCNLTMDYLLEHGANPNIQTYALKLTPAMLYIHIMSRSHSTIPDEPRVNPDESKCMSHLISFGTLFFSAPSIKEGTRELGLEELVEPPWIDWTRSTATLQAVNFVTSVQDPIETVPKLLARSDLNLVDSSGNTYLHLIANIRHYVDEDFLLVHHFPQLDKQWTIRNDDGATPLGLACCNDYITKVPEKFEFLLKLIKELGLKVTESDEGGFTPLYYLTRNKDIMKLINDGMPREWLNLPMPASKRGVLEYALENNNLSEDVLFATVRKDPQVLLQQNWLGQTFLMVILQRILERNTNDFNYLRILLWYKDHLNIQDHNGNTALHIACKYFHLGLVESILGKINNTRYSERFFVTVFKLLEAGCDPSIKNKRGETPQDYVPHMHEYYQSLYLNWIKQLNYKDETPPPHPHKRKQRNNFDFDF